MTRPRRSLIVRVSKLRWVLEYCTVHFILVSTVICSCEYQINLMVSVSFNVVGMKRVKPHHVVYDIKLHVKYDEIKSSIFIPL